MTSSIPFFLCTYSAPLYFVPVGSDLVAVGVVRTKIIIDSYLVQVHKLVAAEISDREGVVREERKKGGGLHVTKDQCP